MRHGVILLLSGASGTGKTTVRDRLLQRTSNLFFAVSCTTRPPRPGETEGADYFFVTEEQFETRVRKDDFLEYAEVHGRRYGTPRSEVEARVRRGQDVLLDIDVQGARLTVDALRDSWLAPLLATVFLAPPSLATLEHRLNKRGTDSPEVIQTRLRNATSELEAWNEFQHLVIVDTPENATDGLEAILEAARRRTAAFPTPPFLA